MARFSSKFNYSIWLCSSILIATLAAENEEQKQIMGSHGKWMLK